MQLVFLKQMHECPQKTGPASGPFPMQMLEIG
jgi:hypothetical protein